MSNRERAINLLCHVLEIKGKDRDVAEDLYWDDVNEIESQLDAIYRDGIERAATVAGYLDSTVADAIRKLAEGEA